MQQNLPMIDPTAFGLEAGFGGGVAMPAAVPGAAPGAAPGAMDRFSNWRMEPQGGVALGANDRRLGDLIRSLVNGPTLRHNAEREARMAPAPGYQQPEAWRLAGEGRAPMPTDLSQSVADAGAPARQPLPSGMGDAGPEGRMQGPLAAGGVAEAMTRETPPSPPLMNRGGFPVEMMAALNPSQSAGVPAPGPSGGRAGPARLAAMPQAPQGRMPPNQGSATATPPILPEEGGAGGASGGAAGTDDLRATIQQALKGILAESGKPIQFPQPQRRDVGIKAPAVPADTRLRDFMIDFGLGLTQNEGGSLARSVGRAGQAGVQAMRAGEASNTQAAMRDFQNRLALEKLGIDMDNRDLDRAFKEAQLGETTKGRQMTALTSLTNVMETADARRDAAKVSADQRRENAQMQRSTMMAIAQLNMAGRQDMADKALQEKKLLRDIEEAKSVDQFYAKLADLGEKMGRVKDAQGNDQIKMTPEVYEFMDSLAVARGLPPVPRPVPAARDQIVPGRRYFAPGGQLIQVTP